MEAMAIVSHSEQAAPRRSRLDISRGRAFLTHLVCSASIVGAVCALIFLVWYPHPYFQAVGAWNVLRVLIGVDVVIGPVLTLIVFKRGKPGLKFDLCFIAAVQLAALIYGLQAIYRERPYFAVFAVDRFYVLAHRDVDAGEMQREKVKERVGTKPARGPLLAVATRPTDTAEYQRLLDETVFQHQPDIERRPHYWGRYADEASQVIAKAKPLATLRTAHPEAATRIDALGRGLGLPEQRLGYVPLIGKNRDLSFVIDLGNGAPIEVLDVDPWGEGDKPATPP
jgi:hypothetical protein